MPLVVVPLAIANEEHRLAAMEHVQRLAQRLSETATEISSLIDAIKDYEASGRATNAEESGRG